MSLTVDETKSKDWDHFDTHHDGLVIRDYDDNTAGKETTSTEKILNVITTAETRARRHSITLGGTEVIDYGNNYLVPSVPKAIAVTDNKKQKEDSFNKPVHQTSWLKHNEDTLFMTGLMLTALVVVATTGALLLANPATITLGFIVLGLSAVVAFSALSKELFSLEMPKKTVPKVDVNLSPFNESDSGIKHLFYNEPANTNSLASSKNTDALPKVEQPQQTSKTTSSARPF